MKDSTGREINIGDTVKWAGETKLDLQGRPINGFTGTAKVSAFVGPICCRIEIAQKEIPIYLASLLEVVE